MQLVQLVQLMQLMQSPASHQQTASNQSHRRAAARPRARRMLQFEHSNAASNHIGSGSPAADSSWRQVKITAPIMARLRTPRQHQARPQICAQGPRPMGSRSAGARRHHHHRRLVLLAVAGWLLVDLAQCSLVRTPAQRLKTRSSSVGGDEDEEFTLAHFGGGREEPPDLWPPRRLNSNTNNDNDNQQQQQQQQQPAARLTKKRHDEDVFDPFASLFEDYLREASGRSRDSDEPVESVAVDSSQLGNSSDEAGDRRRPSNDLVQMIDDDEPEQNNAQQRPRLIIEHDGDDINNGQSRAAAPQQAAADVGQSTKLSLDDNQPTSFETNARPWQVIDDDAQAVAADHDGADRKQDDEIRLQFAWRSLPTNKCSKECGRGRRILHLSCIDLKYNVRVLDELCASARLVKPDELSDDICNEHDCEAQWVELSSPAEILCPEGSEQCRLRARLKRLECMMRNRFGEEIRVDQSRCSNATSPIARTGDEPDDSESGLIDLNEQIDKERNSILSNEVLVEDLDRMPSHGGRRQHSSTSGHSHRPQAKFQRPNEPFYEPGQWSECSGAPCGQLGRRQRRLSCRLFLTRSSRYVELPLARCDALNDPAEKPDQEEPCYMDCGPGEWPTSSSSSSSPSPSPSPSPSSSTTPAQQADANPNGTFKANDSNATRSFAEQQLESALEAGVRPADIEDETVYDLEATRHVWRHGAWTKCSAQCLGGRSESIVECWDRVAELPVDTSLCNTQTRPQPLATTCNVIPCPPEWLPSAFSNCSAACGSAGIRVRDVSCVRRVPIASPSSASWSFNEQLAMNTMGKRTTGDEPQFQLMAVPEEQCLEQQQLNASAGSLQDANTPSRLDPTKPHLVEPCNRHDCGPQWLVGPWSECSRPLPTMSFDCGTKNPTQVDTKPVLSTRNRTVICVQEFASQLGPLDLINKTAHLNDATTMANDSNSSDLREAIKLAASTWTPGKAIQVPLGECFRHHQTVPPLSENCPAPDWSLEAQPDRLRAKCRDQAALDAAQSNGERSQSISIDTDKLQDFRMIAPDGGILTNVDLSHAHNRKHQRIQFRKRIVTLKVGGRAQILEGWTVKIRCRVIKNSDQSQQQSHKHYISSDSGDERGESPALGKQISQRVEWCKDGVRIFAPNTTVAELQQLNDEETDNAILYGNGGAGSGEEGSANNHDRYSMMAADEPPEAHQIRGRRQREKQTHLQHLRRRQSGLSRVLKVRSWPQESSGDDQFGSFQFVHQIGGRFSLVKENTLRIKRLRLEDSGMYSCSTGSLSESIEITVVSRRQVMSSAGFSTTRAE